MTETTQVQPAVETGPKPVTWAPVPKVNLLPVEIVEDRAFRRTQILLAGAVVLAAGVVGVGTLWAQNGVDDAQAEADAAQQRVSQLLTQQADYAQIPPITQQIEAAVAARQAIYAQDVRWYRYLNTFARTAAENGIDMTNITVTMSAGSTGSATTGSDGAGLLAPTGIGTITFAGTTAQYQQLSTWLEGLDRITGIRGASLVNAATADSGDGEEEVAFSNTAVLDDDALSGRYQPRDAAGAGTSDTTESPDATTTDPGSATDSGTATS
jgi:Tfp pilus assembly protein PilN